MSEKTAVERETPIPTAREGESDLAYFNPTVGKIYRFGYDYNGTKCYFDAASLIRTKETAGKFVAHCSDPDTNKYILAVQKSLDSTRPGTMLSARKKKSGELNIPLTYVHPEDDQQAEEDRQHFIWQFVKAENGKFRMWLLGISAYLYIDVDDEQVHHPELGEKRTDGRDLFFLEEVSEYPDVVNIKKHPVPKFKSPELTSYDEPDEFSKAQISGEAAVPWFLVAKDGDYGSDWRAEHSPYYIMRRWSCWHSRNWEIKKQKTSENHDWEVTWGTTEEKAKRIDENLNISVSAEAGFAFKGFSASVSTSVSHSLNVATSETYTKSYSERKSGSYSAAAGDHDLAVCDFYRYDTYRLYRATGEEIFDFPVIVPGTRAGRTYPQKS
jgi:hypothetical protein